MTQPNDAADLINRLARRSGEGPYVSIYLSTSMRPDEQQENEIRMKNLLRSAHGTLESLGLEARAAQGLLERISAAWKQRASDGPLDRGLALFGDAESAESVPLPYSVEEAVFASDRFHLKPLFHDAIAQGSYLVLALSENEVRLFRGNASRLVPVELAEDVPRSLTDVTGSQPAGRHLDHHAGDRGSNAAIFHGHGAGKDDHEAELERFLRELDRALAQVWNVASRPILLAGVESLLARFRSVSEASQLVGEEIRGNVEHLSPGELHEQAWPIVERLVERRKLSLLERLDESGADVPVARQVADVVRAATDGRVDTLFVAGDETCWGTGGEDAGEIRRHEERRPGDHDLLDRAAVESLLNGGKVYLIPASDLPGGTMAVARLRY